MSILNVEHLTHGFGDRAIFSDVSFRLLKGEHIGLVGANGEGKSTFMNIVTGKLVPDEGKVEWSKNVHAGYLDQHAVLEKGMTIRDVLKSAFDPLLQKEQRMNEICDLLGTADEEEMNRLMDELGTIQDELTELNRYVGDYDHFQEVYAVKKAQLEAAYRRQQQEISELKDFVARNKARVSTRNMAMSRQKKLDKMDVIELAAEKPKPEFHFRYGRTPGKMLFETHDLVTGYDEPLSKPLNFSMERGQKIALVGTNGIGKTTLLKSILGLIPSLSGSCELGENLEIGYFEQEVKGENKTTCIDEIWQEFPSFTQYEVRSALAKCGLTTKHIESQVRVLSGGEQAKVRLCKLINRDTNILLLDEPTNHLDVDAKDSLKKALQEYRGSILLICHEPEFYQDVVNEVWDMSKWTTKVF